MKRFYRIVTVTGTAVEGYRVELDGRELRSPAKARLALPTAPLAEAVAAEWEAQTNEIVPSSMPMMSLASTAADRVAPWRNQVIEELLRFGETDLVCYRAEQPDSLIERQCRIWQPLLDWLTMRYDAQLIVTEGVVPQPQSEKARHALRAAVVAFDDMRLAALSVATAAASSLVIALALLDGRLDPEAAAAAAQLDELWQIETWGDDPEAARRRAALAGEIAAAHRFVRLLDG